MSNFVRHSHFCFCFDLCVEFTRLFKHKKLDQIGCSPDESWHSSCRFDCLFTRFAWYVFCKITKRDVVVPKLPWLLEALQSWTSPSCVRSSISGRRSITQRQQPCFLELAWRKSDGQKKFCPSMMHIDGDLVGWLSGSWQHAVALWLQQEALCNAVAADFHWCRHIALGLRGGATVLLHAFLKQMHHDLMNAWRYSSQYLADSCLAYRLGLLSWIMCIFATIDNNWPIALYQIQNLYILLCSAFNPYESMLPV